MQVVHPALVEWSLLRATDRATLDAELLAWLSSTAHAFLDARAQLDPLVPVAGEGRVLLGCYPAVCSRRHLAESGVTHVLNAAANACRSPFARELAYLELALADTPQEPIAEAFETAIAFIRDALDAGGIVAVHCQAGVSRRFVELFFFVLVHQ